MSLVRRRRRRYPRGALTLALHALAGEALLVARVIDHDWGDREGSVSIERSTDNGLSWSSLTTAYGVRPDALGAIWVEYSTDSDPGPQFIRARASVAGALTATVELEAIALDFPPRETHHSVAFVQSVRAGSAGAALLDATITAPTANNLLLAYGSINNASMTVDSCVQNPAGTPVAFTALQATQTGGGANTLRDRVFYLAAATTNTTVRCVFSGSAALGLVVHEYSGHNPTGPIHGYAVAVGSSTAPNSGNITTIQANTMLVGFAKTPNVAGTWTPGGSFTIRQPPSGSQREASSDRSVSAAGTYAASYTVGTTDDWHAWILAIQEPVDPLWANLAGYWKMEEASGTRIDNFSGLSNLTDVNTCTQEAGIISNAVRFTAANTEYLSHVDSEFIGGGDIDFTFNFWIYWITAPGATFPIPLSKDSSGAGSGGDYVLFWDNGAGPPRLKWEVLNGVAGTRTVIGGIYQTTATGTINTWYMITVDHSATNNDVGFRVNGGTRANSATSGATGRTAWEFVIGQRNAASFCDARIDEVGFWKRSITDAEATALYNAGAGLSFPTAPAAGAYSGPGPRPRQIQQAVNRRAVR